MGLNRKVNEYVRKPVAQPSNWEQHQEEEVTFLKAERKRLLYVGCTRAGSQLVISRHKDDNGSFWRELGPFLAEAEVLAVPTPSSAEDAAENEDAPWPTLEACQEQVATRWQNSCSPSYGLVALKETAMKESKRPTWQASGQYGANWGSAIHQLLEVRTKTPNANLQHMAAQLAAEFELGSSRVDEMLLTVDSVLASDIWQRAQRSQAVYSEVPIDSSPVVDGVPTITRGVIDLIFKEPDGWVIVDYKTDDITELDVDAAAEYYRSQLKRYAETWQDVTGESVTEFGCYFTNQERYIPHLT